LLFTGNVTKEKGAGLLVESLSYIKDDLHPFIELRFVGKGNDEYIRHLKDLIKNLNLLMPIIFVGEVPHEQIYKHYLESDIFVFPSFHEGMSLSLLEAMGASLPVVASNICANSALIADGYNGLLFEQGVPEHLAQCLERIILDRNLQFYLGNNAYNFIKTYSWDRISNRYLEVFDAYAKRR